MSDTMDLILTTTRPETDAQIMPQFVMDDLIILQLWEDARDQWLKSVRALSGAENTVTAYQVAHKQFFFYAGMRPWQVSTGVAQRWVNWMREEGKAVIDRKTGEVIRREGLAESSINLKLAAMSSFYEYAQYNYLYPKPDDPRLDYFIEAEPPLLFLSQDGREVKLWPYERANPFNPKIIKRTKVGAFDRAKYPSTDELKAMLAAINTDSLQGKRDLALLYTIAVTCRRSSEVLNLRWGDLRPTGDGNYVFSYRYKGGEMKQAVMDAACYGSITNFLHAADRLDGIEAEDFIFTPLRPELSTRLPTVERVDPGQPISNTMANQILKKYARRADVALEKAHIHGLRHAGARLRREQMKQNGRSVDYEEIQKLLGHSSLAVTQIYTNKVLEDPEDPGARDAALALMPTGKRYRRRKPQPEQSSFV